MYKTYMLLACMLRVHTHNADFAQTGGGEKRKKKTYRASPGRVTIATIVGATWEHVADAGGAGVAGILAVREAPSDPCGKRLGFESFPLHGPEPVLTNDRSSLDGMRIYRCC